MNCTGGHLQSSCFIQSFSHCSAPNYIGVLSFSLLVAGSLTCMFHVLALGTAVAVLRLQPLSRTLACCQLEDPYHHCLSFMQRAAAHLHDDTVRQRRQGPAAGQCTAPRGTTCDLCSSTNLDPRPGCRQWLHMAQEAPCPQQALRWNHQQQQALRATAAVAAAATGTDAWANSSTGHAP